MYCIYLLIVCVCCICVCNFFIYVMCYYKMYCFLGNSYEIKYVYLFECFVIFFRFRICYY